MSSEMSSAEFRGIESSSKYGSNNVLRYDIPGGSLCYTFMLHRRNRDHDVYRCVGCKVNRTYTNVRVQNRVFFMNDPCRLAHNCLPKKSAQDESTRIVYKVCREVASKPELAEKRPRQLWQEVGNFIDFQSSEDPRRREEMLHYFHRSGYESRRRVFYNALGKLQDHRVSMTEVPEEYANLPDGTRFLQHSSAGMHVYFSAELIQRACAVGLSALVADGVHDLQPDVTNKNGQLYVVHGVTFNGVDVPLLFAITTRKTEAVYLKVFRCLMEAMAPAPHQGLRVVMDFERAAINAAKRVFPSASVEGCAFHLAQAWNRKRDALGLRPFLRGTQRSEQIRKWWSTIKGIVFLPPHLHRRVPALVRPPVSQQHPAYDRCRMFLEYLHTTWYAGPFKDMWHKWDVSELRTSNVAESFNRLLGILLGVKHPRLSKLILALQRSTSDAKGALLNVERRRTDGKRLSRRDLRRRRRVQREMNRFKSVMEENRGFLRTVTINTYCRRISRFVTEKLV